MPRYFYTAKSLKNGKQESGTLEVKDVYQLARSLRQQDLMLIKAEPAKGKTKKKKLDMSISFLDKVSLADKMFFTRNLQIMIAALRIARQLRL